MRHWTIRTINDNEVIGIVKVSWLAAIDQGIFRIITEEIGHGNWWLDSITKVEFETYQTFGIKVYRI